LEAVSGIDQDAVTAQDASAQLARGLAGVDEENFLVFKKRASTKRWWKIVPILKKQPGFVDEIVLVSDADSNRILALSFWKAREDAERYQREQYNSVRETLQSLLEAEPVVRTFEVYTSTGHKITAGKAA
jgi:heme-degrading monooxygenase HmoA